MKIEMEEIIKERKKDGYDDIYSQLVGSQRGKWQGNTDLGQGKVQPW